MLLLGDQRCSAHHHLGEHLPLLDAASHLVTDNHQLITSSPFISQKNNFYIQAGSKDLSVSWGPGSPVPHHKLQVGHRIQDVCEASRCWAQSSIGEHTLYFGEGLDFWFIFICWFGHAV